MQVEGYFASFKAQNQAMNYPVIYHLRLMFSCCTQWRSEREVPFNSVARSYQDQPMADVEERDVTEEDDEDDEDGIRFA